jgi:adenylate cyclase
VDHADVGVGERHTRNITGARYGLVRESAGSGHGPVMITAASVQSNVDPVSRSAPYSGYFNMFPDPDGVVRWLPAVIRFEENYYAPLSLMALSAFLGRPLSIYLSPYAVEGIAVGDQQIPTDEYGRMLINYRGGPKTFRHVSVTDILNDRVPGDLFRDRIVVVGATAQGIFDFQVSPFSNVFPGVEIHANIIDAVLANDYLRQPTWSAVCDILAMVSLGLALGLILPSWGVVTGALAWLTAFWAYIFFTQYLFNTHGWVLNLVYPLSVATLVYVLITSYKYLMESRQRRFIKNAFSTYLAPAVVKELIESRERLELGGEEREITAFFSDVQGFTSISERLTPKQLVELLNEFLTEMTDILLNHKGTVDKFEGDAIIAFFGAPTSMPRHAEAACLASIRMQTRLAALRRTWRSRGQPELHMRIGLCTGSAVVGNMGSRNRMDYTMMGDTVNTAARLEGINKIYGSYTLVGETTREAAGGRIVAREIDTVNAVGKGDPVTIYQLLGENGDIEDRLLRAADAYATGLAAYRTRDWPRALAGFGEALRLVPDDGPSRAMHERCTAFQATPPPDDWNGSFVITTK